MKKLLTIAMLLMFTVSAFAGKPQPKDPKKITREQVGKASWYSVRTNSGSKTASGKKLTNKAPVAAHKTLPLGAKVKVTNLKNGKDEIVTIIDRGPYVRGRIIDVSVGVADRLGFKNQGIAEVKIEVLQ